MVMKQAKEKSLLIIQSTLNNKAIKTAAKKGIRANSVAPGPVWTPLIPASFDENGVENFGQDTLMNRPGQPSEHAWPYVMLASDEASYMTGQEHTKNWRSIEAIYRCSDAYINCIYLAVSRKSKSGKSAVTK